VPTEAGSSTCEHCGAALVADQRYCLSCGKPAAPVRLAFLDVLQSESSGAAGQPTIEMHPAGYVPVGDSRGANGWLRRNTGLLALLAVLALCLIAGLLVGHWVSQGNKAPSKQVVEVRGLSGLAAAAPAASSTSTTPAATSGGSGGIESKSSAKEEAEAKKAEAKETKAEKAPPPAPKKVAPAKIKKLTESSGKKHQEEIDALGSEPIETG
jgi:hypothetical protein